MTTQLTLYNGALRILGEGALVTTADATEPQRILTAIWDDGARDACLEAGYWNFAMRTQALTYNPAITPSFGYQYAINRPTDLVRIAAVCTDEYLNEPLLEYFDENNYFLCDYDTLYVKYISNDASYGYDLSLWPRSFVNYFHYYLALNAAPRLTQLSAAKKDVLMSEYKQALNNALSKDAMKSPTYIPPSGSWARSRGRGSLERGKRTSLYG